MGANCQNCDTLPPEINIRHHHKFMSTDKNERIRQVVDPQVEG